MSISLRSEILVNQTATRESLVQEKSRPCSGHRKGRGMYQKLFIKMIII